MRVALFGGTFDPPHVGHLLVASDAVDQLNVDRLVFIPASRQPLKRDVALAPAADRLRMVQLLVAGDDRFAVDETEIHRTGLSYTVDTLQEFAGRMPDSERYFLVGTDAFAALGQWKDPGRVVSLARLVVLWRGRTADEGPVAIGPDPGEITHRVREIGGEAAIAPVVMATRRIDVSSTEIRERVRGGRPIRGFVTDAVAEYIDTNGLYR